MRRLLFLSFLFLPVPLVAQDALRVERAGSAVTASAARDRGYAAYPASALEALGAEVTVDAGRVRAVLLDDTLRFEALSPFFRVGTSVQQLADAVYVTGGVAYLPRQLFTEWLPSRYPGRVSYDAGVLRARGLLGRAAAPEGGSGGAGERADGGARPSAGATKSAARPVVGGSSTRRAPGRADARVVVIDAGHGGKDPGRIGPGGVREKDVTLLLAQRLASLLEGRGYEVHLTRTRDTLISLADRPRFANEWKAGRPAALFVSIHCNGGGRSAKGFETYFLSDARTADARRVAEMENAAERFEEKAEAAKPELEGILNNLRNDFYVKASDDLAEAVQRRLAAIHPGPNRGVQQAGFRVLVGAFMPAVLVETAFISNREEERLLSRSSFQGKLVWAVAEAVDGFFDSHEHLWADGGRP
ncbi:MAG TPA: N-acetylmuramoyl-L-alanine amidase [Longimicrobiales bacterium]|nr:N-acetylmuramoyl-L-alanine amidase [Longimicrobiales bacterium]